MKNKMKKMAVLLVAGLALGVASAVATTTGITLGEGDESTTFIGTGGSNSLALDLGSCSGGSCTMTGVAYGTGLFSSAGEYDITSPANTPLILINPTTGLWKARTNGNTIDFSYGPGGSLLTGYLNLLQFQQIPKPISGSENWYLTSANLTVTGGSLSIAKGDNVSVDWIVPSYLNTLLGSTSTMATNFGHGSLSPTPEPASVLLLGIGFLFIGTVLRFRFRHSPWNS